MPLMNHPAWSGSKIPPRILSKINNLDSESRRNYLSDLIANYEAQTANIEAVAKRMSDNYTRKQTEHLRAVLRELWDIFDMELGHEPTFHEVDSYGKP